jgi:hypothetical protein
MKWLLLSLVVLTSGCSVLLGDPRYGYKDYDPCIRCGEKWDQFPNEPFEAQRRRARGEQW